MTDILFGQSYFLRFDPKLWEAMQPYPPLGTLFAASYLRRAGYLVVLFDSMLADSTAEWEAALDECNPKYAVIYEDNFNYLSKMCLLNMREAAFEMIEMAKGKDCKVIVAGSDASDHYRKYLEAGADYVLIGEGEKTLAELLELIEKGTGKHDEILGLAYLHKGQMLVNPRRPDITKLNDLPFPAWNLVDVDKYRHIWLERHGYFSMNMVTTRGCPFHCNWCAKPIWGQRYNTRSPEHVASEMKLLKDNYGPDHLWFADDIMGLKPGWLDEFASQVAAQQAQVPFKCLSRADLLLRDGDIEALAAAGCQIVWIGAESGSQKILDAMDKGTRVEQIREAAKRLQQAGIQVGFFLQFGYPGEGWPEIELTLQLVRDCMPDDIGISVSYPLPGTKFFNAVQNELQGKQNWIDSNDLEMMYQGAFVTDFYRQLYLVVHKEFRARKTWYALNSGERVSPLQVAKAIYQVISLPLARFKLDQLAKIPHEVIRLQPQMLHPDEAARPSSQE